MEAIGAAGFPEESLSAHLEPLRVERTLRVHAVLDSVPVEMSCTVSAAARRDWCCLWDKSLF